MYYLLRDKDGEAYCAIVIPEATNNNQNTVALVTYGTRINIGTTRVYDIKEVNNMLFIKELGTVSIDWETNDKIPNSKRPRGVRLVQDVIHLEQLSKAQFETYVLLGLPCVTREEANPFYILATMDI